MPKATEILAMLDNMVRQRYELPPAVEVSPAGKELLTRMLHPDPRERIPIEAVMADPWFTTNLPPEAATMNANYLSQSFPPGHQTPAEIKGLLEEAKGRGGRAGAGSGGPGGAAAGGGGEGDADSLMMDTAIQEDLRENRSVELQQYVQTYR